MLGKQEHQASITQRYEKEKKTEVSFRENRTDERCDENW